MQKLHSRTSRKKLAAGQRFHEHVANGQYLCYRRPQNGSAGTWSARFLDEFGSEHLKKMALADDDLPANGKTVMSYAQAILKVRDVLEILRLQSRAKAAGEYVIDVDKYTVAQAMNDYFENKERTGKRNKGLKYYKQNSDAYVIPELGRIPMVLLTKTRIEKWLSWISMSPRRTKKFAQPPKSDEEKRARKETANRNLGILCAALNYAVKNNIELARECIPYQWRLAERFEGTGKSRDGKLSKEDRSKLLQACNPDFRDLVLGALLTGARYGEIIRFKCRDYQHGSIYVPDSKSGKPRTIQLTQAGVAFFDKLIQHRRADELIFTRANGNPWIRGAQTPLMTKSCKDAGIAPIVFHELRHERMSKLANAGLEPELNALLAGHSDTKMGERYYIHRENRHLIARIEETGGQDDWELLKIC